MNTWIEINLPWSMNKAVEVKANRLRKRASKLYEKAFAKAEKQLGETLDQAREKLDAVRTAALQRKQGANYCGLPTYPEDLDKLKKKYPVLDVNVVKTPPDCCDVDWFAGVYKRVKRNPVAVALAEYYHYKYMRDRLAEATPECWKAQDLEDEAHELIRVGSFHNYVGDHEMCRPGVLLEVKRGDEIKQLLIGHIGPAGGPAEWEMGEQVIKEDDMVVRAMVVWTPNL